MPTLYDTGTDPDNNTFVAFKTLGELEPFDPKIPGTCSVCGEYTLIAINIKPRAISHNPETHALIDQLNERFGGGEFNVCYSCLLLAFGVRPRSKDPQAKQ